MRPTCARAWEVEAVADGRLGADDRSAFDRHVEQCLECRESFADVQRVRGLVRSIELPQPTELERRRLRARVLEEANRRSIDPPTRKGRWAFAVVLVALAAFVPFAIVKLAARRSPPTSPSSPASPASIVASSSASAGAPRYTVETLRAARWRVVDPGPAARVALDDGSARFTVEHLLPSQRFVVALPDGDVEVRGTSFVLDVRDGATRSVRVDEGIVAAVIGGESHVLTAGTSWSPHSTASAASSATIVVVHAPSIASPLQSPAPSPPKPASSSASSSSSPAATAPAGPRFLEAMSAYSAGDYAHADSFFARFVDDFPTDARAEDASFLRAVARARFGDQAGAAERARAYLARYPSGFHRKEAEAYVAAP